MVLWKNIEDYPNYEVSNEGQVRNKITGNVLKGEIVKDKGYRQVTLSKNGNRERFKVHRLVANAFIPNPNNLPQVNHKDENKLNNNVENLEWCSASYNVNYGTRNRQVAIKMKDNTSSPMIKVQKLDMEGNVLAEYRSMKRASEENNIPRGNLTKYFKEGWKSCGGYQWRKVK